jgi:hypothetical protein
MDVMPREESHEPRDSVKAERERPVAVDRQTRLFRRRKPTVIDGPFTESKELLGGSWPTGSVRRRQ